MTARRWMTKEERDELTCRVEPLRNKAQKLRREISELEAEISRCLGEIAFGTMSGSKKRMEWEKRLSSAIVRLGQLPEPEEKP